MSTAAPAEPRASALRARALTKRFGARAALRAVSFDLRAGELVGDHRAQRRRQDDAAVDPRRRARADEGELSRPGGDAGWVPQQPALYSKLSVAENLRLFARLEKLADPDAAVDRMLEQTGARGPRRRGGRAASPAATSSASTSRSAGSRNRRCCSSTSPRPRLIPRQRERLWQFISELIDRGTTVVFSTHNVAEVERYANRVLLLADGELLFTGTPGELEQAVGGDPRDLEAALVGFLHQHGH